MHHLGNILRELGHAPEGFSKQRLTMFSDLEKTQAESLWEIWQSLPTSRRKEIAQALHMLAEEHAELDFRQMFFLCLNDAEETIRAIALDGLWEDDHLSTLRRVRTIAVEDRSSMVRAAALITLSHFAYQAELGDLPAEEAHLLYTTLLDLFRSPAQPLEVRRRALESLGYFSGRQAVREAIQEAYATPEQPMRESALVAMGRSMDQGWVATITRELQSPFPALRYEAARAAGEMGEEAFLPALVPLTDDEDDEVAQAAIWAIGQIGGDTARRILTRIAQCHAPIRADAANEALAVLAVYDDEWP